MPIPDFQSCFMPILKTLSERGVMTSRDLVVAICDHFALVLIDGRRLAELMIDHNVGVATVAVYPVKRIDSDFFSDD